MKDKCHRLVFLDVADMVFPQVSVRKPVSAKLAVLANAANLVIPPPPANQFALLYWVAVLEEVAVVGEEEVAKKEDVHQVLHHVVRQAEIVYQLIIQHVQHLHRLLLPRLLSLLEVSVRQEGLSNVHR